MVQLTPIQLEDGTTIYIEATENVTVPVTEVSESETDESSDEETPQEKGIFDRVNPSTSSIN